MTRFYFAILLILLGSHSLLAQDQLAWEENKAVQRIKLKQAAGGKVNFRDIHQHAAVVLVFLSPECPLSQTYVRTLRELHAQFHENEIAFYAVFPGNSLSPAAVEAFRTANELPFPFLMDTDFALASALQARATPEVFLLDPWGGVKYRGAIDDRAVALGKLRAVATESYLAEALEKWLMTEPFWPVETKAVGCLIELP